MKNILRITLFFILVANFSSVTFGKMRASTGLSADIVLLNGLVGQKDGVANRGFGGVAGVSLANSFAYDVDIMGLSLYFGSDVDFRYSGLAQFGITKASDKDPVVNGFNSFKVTAAAKPFSLITVGKNLHTSTNPYFTIGSNADNANVKITKTPNWTPEKVTLASVVSEYSTAAEAQAGYKAVALVNSGNLGAVLIQKNTQAGSIAHKELFNVKVRPFVGYELSSLLPQTTLAGIINTADIGLFVDIGPTAGYSLYNNVFSPAPLAKGATAVTAPKFVAADNAKQDGDMKFKVTAFGTDGKDSIADVSYTGADIQNAIASGIDSSASYLSLGVGLSGGASYGITDFLDVSFKLKYAMDGIFNISKKANMNVGILPQVVAYKFLKGADDAAKTVTYSDSESVANIIKLQTGTNKPTASTVTIKVTHTTGGDISTKVTKFSGYAVKADAKISALSANAKASLAVVREFAENSIIKIGGAVISLDKGTPAKDPNWGFMQSSNDDIAAGAVSKDNTMSNGKLFVADKVIGGDDANKDKTVKVGMVLYTVPSVDLSMNNANMQKIALGFVNNAKGVIGDSIAANLKGGDGVAQDMQIFAPRFSYENSGDSDFADFKTKNVGMTFSHTISLALGASYVF